MKPTHGGSALKVVLIIAGIFVLLAVGIGGAGYLWFQKNKDRLKEVVERTTVEGQTYGKGKASQECTAEALRRLKGVKGIWQEIWNKVFLESCLEAATEPAGFCDGVPARWDFEESEPWSKGICAGAGFARDERCQRLLQSLQQHCEKKGDRNH